MTAYRIALAIKLLVVLMGVWVLTGLPPFTYDTMPSPLHEVFGVVIVIYGVFRTVLHIQSNRRRTNDEDTQA